MVVRLLASISTWFYQARLDQTHFSCRLLPPHEPIETGHQESHNDDAIVWSQVQLIWALSVVPRRGKTGSPGCREKMTGRPSTWNPVFCRCFVPIALSQYLPNCKGKSQDGFPSPTKILSVQDLRNHLWRRHKKDTKPSAIYDVMSALSPYKPLGGCNSLVKGGDWLQSRFGCSAPGSVRQAEDGPPWAQEGRLKLGYVSLLQVQVSSRGGAVKHLVGGTASKQRTWEERERTACRTGNYE